MGGVVIDHLTLAMLPLWAAICMFVALLAATIWEIYTKRRPQGARERRQ